MSTLAELNTHRTDAGAAYVAAFTTLRAAYITLAAIDRALANRGLGGATGSVTNSFYNDRLQIVSAFRELRHRQFLPAADGNMESEIVAAMEARIAAFPTPD